jgi:hypothetical protein
MRCGARGLALIAAMLLLLVGGVAAAQDKPAEKPASKPAEKAADKPADKPADNLDVLRDKLRADKRLVVAEALELTEKEAQAFWPVYNAYQSDMIAHYDRIFKLLDTYAGSYKSMTDAVATQLLGEFLSVQTSYLNIITSYVPRFQKVLPPRKVARLYQLENKIRALVDYQFAQDVPLIK